TGARQLLRQADRALHAAKHRPDDDTGRATTQDAIEPTTSGSEARDPRAIERSAGGDDAQT
ncbi:hypothetical protein Q5424_08405, partial [Conexibacter sp. JD483]|uniref:hypothetical protein n=1 Tax=unclassified Conexibacter TaxID=2627773 RepID=UPI0027207FF5